MCKKLIAMVLALSMLIISTTSAFAANPQNFSNKNLKEIFLKSTPVKNTSSEQFTFVYHEKSPTKKSLFSSNNTQKVVTTITIIPADEEEANLLKRIMRSSGGENYKYEWDSTRGIKAYTRVCYSEPRLSNGAAGLKLEYVSGGYDKSDRSLRVVSQSVTMGATDPSHYGQHIDKSPKGDSWYYDAPYSWEPIDNNQGFAKVLGGYYKLTIRRNSSPWDVEVINNIVNESFWPTEGRWKHQ